MRNVVGVLLSRPSHRHCRHRCERPLRMDAPSTGWVTALAGLLGRGPFCLVGLPSCPVAVFDERLAAHSCGGSRGFPLCLRAPRSLFRLRCNRRTSTLKCSLGIAMESRRPKYPEIAHSLFRERGITRHLPMFSCHRAAVFCALSSRPYPQLMRIPMSITRLLQHTGIFAAAALIAIAVGGRPAAAVGTDNPPAPASDSSKKSDKEKKSEKKKKNDKSGALSIEQKKVADAKFLEGYRAAREMILAGKYEDGIAAMHALGHDEHPDVANYIGYSYRKLGDYDQSKHWYELALAADPRHVRTWSYYGMWQAEQGNRLKAEDFLQKVKLICGNET